MMILEEVATGALKGNPAWWEIMSAVGTVAAVVVALALAATEARRRRAEERKIRKAIAPALVGDLRTMKQILDTLNIDLQALKAERIVHANRLKDLVSRTSASCLPAFDKFNALLPSLGRSVAPVVIEAYADTVRLAELINAYSREERTFSHAINYANKNIEPVRDRINTAIELLESRN